MDELKLKIRVVSVPVGLTDEELEGVLNAPYTDGYYLDRLVDEHDGRIRALYRLRLKPENETGEAAAFVRANPNLTVKQTVQGLAAKGITRGIDWVTKQKKLV